MTEKYLEVKWHGRRGQGVMTNAAVLAEVLALAGKYVQAFPRFSKEKNCAFVEAYTRVADVPLRIHTGIDAAGIVVIMDPTLIVNVNPELKAGVKEDALYIVNTPAAPDVIKGKLDIPGSRVFTLDADTITREEMGKSSISPNIPLMTVLTHCMGGISSDTFKERLQQVLSSRQWQPTLMANVPRSVDRGLNHFMELDTNHKKIDS
jgi:pyruvate ferredoxin oxidoreductase gamma subunit